MRRPICFLPVLLLLLAAVSTAPQRGAPVVLFFGDSLTAGFGVEPSQAFPARVQELIEEAGLNFRVEAAGVSGETSAGGLRRIDWVLQQPVAVLVLELGGNDGLRGIPPEETRANLQAIIGRTLAMWPDAEIVLAGMRVPPSLGARHTEAFREIFPELAAANDAELIPFLLEGVGGRPELNLPDGIHPTPEGHARVAVNVWRVLEPVLRELDAEPAPARP